MKKWLFIFLFLVCVVFAEVTYLLISYQARTKRIEFQQKEISRTLDSLEKQTTRLEMKFVSMKERLKKAPDNSYVQPVLTHTPDHSDSLDMSALLLAAN